MHVDREEEYTDHHTFFFSMNDRIGPHHCSFEVHDPDIQAIGHDVGTPKSHSLRKAEHLICYIFRQWLASKGYTAAWGVGRHILGSQVFDYWYMPDDFMIEHYSDGRLLKRPPIYRFLIPNNSSPGDLVNCHTETGVLPASDEALAVWGPAVRESGFVLIFRAYRF